MKVLSPVRALLIATGLALPAQHGWAQLANPSSPSGETPGEGATA